MLVGRTEERKSKNENSTEVPQKGRVLAKSSIVDTIKRIEMKDLQCNCDGENQSLICRHVFNAPYKTLYYNPTKATEHFSSITDEFFEVKLLGELITNGFNDTLIDLDCLRVFIETPIISRYISSHNTFLLNSSIAYLDTSSKKIDKLNTYHNEVQILFDNILDVLDRSTMMPSFEDDMVRMLGENQTVELLDNICNFTRLFDYGQFVLNSQGIKVYKMFTKKYLSDILASLKIVADNKEGYDGKHNLTINTEVILKVMVTFAELKESFSHVDELTDKLIRSLSL